LWWLLWGVLIRDRIQASRNLLDGVCLPGPARPPIHRHPQQEAGGRVCATTTYQTNYYDYHCEIRVFVDGSNEIIDWDAKGNLGGCEPYNNALKE